MPLSLLPLSVHRNHVFKTFFELINERYLNSKIHRQYVNEIFKIVVGSHSWRKG